MKKILASIMLILALATFVSGCASTGGQAENSDAKSDNPHPTWRQ